MDRLRTLGLRLYVWVQILAHASPKRFAALVASLILAAGAVVPILEDPEHAQTIADVVTSVVGK
ncbi:hypothetical protein [Streptomyces zaomyceticus]|uniref:hypothetical protein n=1 Tax=Streptomyces zaomyceticus TaxID=68286 RepID=UPI00342BFA57